jgi:hypothetical protein
LSLISPQGHRTGWQRIGAAGRAEGEANALLRLLEKKFPPGTPADTSAAIRAATDLERLRQWFDLALTSASLDAFRQAAGI